MAIKRRQEKGGGKGDHCTQNSILLHVANSNVRSKEEAWGPGLGRLLAAWNRLGLGPMGTEPTRSFRTDVSGHHLKEGLRLVISVPEFLLAGQRGRPQVRQYMSKGPVRWSR